MTAPRTIFTVIALALATALIAAAAARRPRLPRRYDDQRSLTIYQVMVASFNRDTTATVPGYTAMWGPDGNRKDGNIAGITAALDHIAAIGANAIWLTPIFDSSKAKGGEKLQATGYFANDYFAIDPHFGTFATCVASSTKPMPAASTSSLTASSDTTAESPHPHPRDTPSTAHPAPMSATPYPRAMSPTPPHFHISAK